MSDKANRIIPLRRCSGLVQNAIWYGMKITLSNKIITVPMSQMMRNVECGCIVNIGADSSYEELFLEQFCFGTYSLSFIFHAILRGVILIFTVRLH